MGELRRIKYLRKSNHGNKSPRTLLQINSSIRRMLLDNPLKNPTNRINQSLRMFNNQLWKSRKGKRIKQQPSS